MFGSGWLHKIRLLHVLCHNTEAGIPLWRMFVTNYVIHLGWQEGVYQEVDISKALTGF